MNERWTLYPKAEKALKKVGNDLRDARRRRRISTTTLAERAQISRATLYRIEKGDSGVSMSSYAADTSEVFYSGWEKLFQAAAALQAGHQGY